MAHNILHSQQHTRACALKFDADAASAAGTCQHTDMLPACQHKDTQLY
jgi:hypothetical protein